MKWLCNTKSLVRNKAGFTLVEALIGIAITGLATGAIFGVYIANAKNNEIQNQIVDLQQSLRASLHVMTSEIKMAGYASADPEKYGIVLADPGEIQFTVDWQEDGGEPTTPEEYIAYVHYQETKLGRGVGQAYTYSKRPLSEQIDAVGFAYAFDVNGDGLLDNEAGRVHWGMRKDVGGELHWFDLDTNKDGSIDSSDGTGSTINGYDTTLVADNPPPPVPPNTHLAPISDIRAVRIWLLGRATQPDPNYTNNETYVVGNQILTFNDHYRRRLLTTTVTCRNLGL